MLRSRLATGGPSASITLCDFRFRFSRAFAIALVIEFRAAVPPRCRSCRGRRCGPYSTSTSQRLGRRLRCLLGTPPTPSCSTVSPTPLKQRYCRPIYAPAHQLLPDCRPAQQHRTGRLAERRVFTHRRCRRGGCRHAPCALPAATSVAVSPMTAHSTCSAGTRGILPVDLCCTRWRCGAWRAGGQRILIAARG